MDKKRIIAGLKLVGSGLGSAVMVAAAQYLQGVDFAAVFGMPAFAAGIVGSVLHAVRSPLA